MRIRYSVRCSLAIVMLEAAPAVNYGLFFWLHGIGMSSGNTMRVRLDGQQLPSGASLHTNAAGSR